MKNIAFLRAKNSKTYNVVKESLHPEFIVEFADTTLFDKDFHKPEDGYEILPEDDFEKEFAKNDGYASEFAEQRKAIINAMIESNKEEFAISKESQRSEYHEYQEFQAWKRRMDTEKLNARKLEIEKLYRKQQGLED